VVPDVPILVGRKKALAIGLTGGRSRLRQQRIPGATFLDREIDPVHSSR
jgi:hypothetical protein